MDDVLVEVEGAGDGALDDIATCAWLAHSADEGEVTLSIARSSDGAPASIGPASAPLTPFSRCASEVLCRRGSGAATSVRVRVTSRGGGDADVSVSTLARHELTEFAGALLSTAAHEAGVACSASARVSPPARLVLDVAVRTSRSLATLRREGRVTSVAAVDARGLPPDVAACVSTRLAGVAWGDRFAPAGAGGMRLEVAWRHAAPASPVPFR